MPRKKAEETAEKKPAVRRAKKKTTEKVKEKVVASKVSSVDDLMNCVVNNPNLIRQLESLGFKSKNKGGMTYREAMICGQITNAVKGDLKAFRAVMDYAEKQEQMPLEDYVRGSMSLVMEDMIGG